MAAGTWNDFPLPDGRDTSNYIEHEELRAKLRGSSGEVETVLHEETEAFPSAVLIVHKVFHTLRRRGKINPSTIVRKV